MADHNGIRKKASYAVPPADAGQGKRIGRNLLRAGLLTLAALILALGLEWIMQRSLPPIFVDSKVDISSDPTLIERGRTYLHSSGRLALVEEWDLKRLAFTFALQLALLTAVFPLGLGRRFLVWVRQTAASLKAVFTREKARNWKLACCFAITFAAVFFLGKVWIRDVYHRDNWMTWSVCFWAALGAGCLTTFRRTLAKKPEVFFLLLTLIVGGLFAWRLPAATRVSLDDGYHFQHASNYSTLGRVRFTGTDWDLMQEDNPRDYELAHWEESRDAEDAKYAEGAVYVTSGFHLNIKEYWTATSGLGLFLGRVFRLHYRDMWSLGRFTGLMAYAILGYFAIRRLKSGKMILSLAMMTPSAVFLAANYSYDPGVTAGIFLSCAYWLAQWQERDQPLKNGDVAVMLLGMLAACYAKAIYFPIFLLFFFLPESKFRDKKHRRLYWGIMALSIVVVMLYILLPLGRSGGEADNRAEGNVNTFGQIQFILQHPLQYAEYLWHFLQYYLDPGHMDGLVSSFGYMGGGICTTLILMTLAVVTFTDAAEEGLLPPAGARGAGLIILFGTLALMSTAMYAWFSEVGSATFDGMQPRYLIPLIYPAMALMGSNRTRNQVNPALYNGILFALMVFASVSGLLHECVEYYH